MLAAKDKKELRTGLYARVSTSNHKQDVNLQLQELRQAAEQRSWSVVDTYIDDGISGAQDNRPALNRMMQDARCGKLDLIAVWKLDRLGRSLKHLLTILDELNTIKVGFVSIRDAGIDTTTATGKLMLMLIGAFAEYERSMIIERVKAGVEKAKANGIHCGRPRQELDLRAAIALLKQKHSIREISSMLKISRQTLTRRLREAGYL